MTFLKLIRGGTGDLQSTAGVRMVGTDCLLSCSAAERAATRASSSLPCACKARAKAKYAAPVLDEKDPG